MSDISEEVCALQASIKKQQSTVRQLKKDYAEGASNLDKEAFGKLLDNEVRDSLRTRYTEIFSPILALPMMGSLRTISILFDSNYSIWQLFNVLNLSVSTTAALVNSQTSKD